MTWDKNPSHKTRVGILYFSGAGNTECIATLIRNTLARREDYEAVFFERIRRALNIRALPEFDLLGIGFPIYFRKTPAIVFDTIGQLQERGRKVFTFCTKGMYSGNVAREVLSRCVASGVVPAVHFEAFMPGTDALILFARKGSWTEKLIKKMHSRHLDRKIDRFVQDVFNTEKISIPRSKWYTPLENRIVKPMEHLITRDYQVFK